MTGLNERGLLYIRVIEQIIRYEAYTKTNNRQGTAFLLKDSLSGQLKHSSGQKSLLALNPSHPQNPRSTAEKGKVSGNNRKCDVINRAGQSEVSLSAIPRK